MDLSDIDYEMRRKDDELQDQIHKLERRLERLEREHNRLEDAVSDHTASLNTILNGDDIQ